MKEVLRVENLRKSYHKNEVLKGVSFSINEGETKVIIGPSGGGKSTLLYCINHLQKPDSGEIYLDSELITPKNIYEARKKIGFVFQYFNLFMHLTALDNVMIGLTKVKKLPKDEALKIAKNSLLLVGIKEDLWSHYPAQLSGGQQQRVAIARAIAMSPRIVLFDEPTSALDVELIGEVLQAMKTLRDKGMTMLIVTHELEFARNVAHEIMFLESGVIVEKGPPKEIIENPKSERLKKFLSKIAKGEE
ncbi:amino acid ABC transporter ATP-binding protein [Caldisericum exile]|uniref:Amino acid ABC transporter ATP-binding protein n=1 Tax=Caldisericum exile (strain DSM 21853 / NBRC 104410 / AZM16c01) TaxID=511051 RepID=A0A7U6GFK2_CALEA|nr:amino acid ABC transporter ATP-binding protein [Caldisericum exile]BAL81474.1 amino acid ABC transporter ATP-binding protein [Caldisericum exile AZM16c01]